MASISKISFTLGLKINILQPLTYVCFQKRPMLRLNNELFGEFPLIINPQKLLSKKAN